MTDDTDNTKPTTMQTLAVHAVCVLIIAACTAIAASPWLQGQTALQWLIIGAALWLWGKLGFKPAEAILDRILVDKIGVTLQTAKQLTQRPPAPAPTDVPPTGAT